MFSTKTVIANFMKKAMIKKMIDLVWMVERNIHGAWVVYGACGIKQYYYCTKTEAKRKYKEDADVFYNRKEVLS